MSHIFATTVEGIFDGRRTKQEKVGRKVEKGDGGCKVDGFATCSKWNGYENGACVNEALLVEFYKAQKG